MADVVQMAFTPDQVSDLTGLSRARLYYWIATGFFSAELSDDESSPPLFTFRDVVGLRVIAILRNDHQIPLQELRKVASHLHQVHETPWASLRLFVAGKRVYFEDPRSGARIDARGTGQVYVHEMPLERVEAETSRHVQELRKRRAEQFGRVERRRNVARNAFHLSGTRIPTSAIWNFHAAGYKTKDIIREYPTLTAADVREAIRFEKKERTKRRRTA